MKDNIPANVLQLNDELYRLCSKRADVPIEDVAKLLGMHHETLRRIISEGNCPFGLGLPRTELRNGIYRVPALTLFNWVTGGVLYKGGA